MNPVLAGDPVCMTLYQRDLLNEIIEAQVKKRFEGKNNLISLEIRPSYAKQCVFILSLPFVHFTSQYGGELHIQSKCKLKAYLCIYLTISYK